MSTGARKKQKRAKRASAASKKTRKSKKITLPKTVRPISRQITEKQKFSRATTSMSLTELQILAKSRGLPFGGLSKSKLIRKINNYY